MSVFCQIVIQSDHQASNTRGKGRAAADPTSGHVHGLVSPNCPQEKKQSHFSRWHFKEKGPEICGPSSEPVVFIGPVAITFHCNHGGQIYNTAPPVSKISWPGGLDCPSSPQSIWLRNDRCWQLDWQPAYVPFLYSCSAQTIEVKGRGCFVLRRYGPNSLWLQRRAPILQESLESN